MMAALFIFYIVALLLIGRKWKNSAFTLIVINLIFCTLMLIYHTTDLLTRS